MQQWLPYSESADMVTDFCRFVARQPVVDRTRRTYGYELLFRTGWENRFTADGELATRHMIDNIVSFGMDSLVGDTRPFVNCTRDTMLQRMPTVLPTDTVLEVLEDIEVDDEFIRACKELRSQGYQLALDDFNFSECWEALIPFVSFIKLDFRACTRQQRSTLMYRLKYHDIRFIAEKIESQEEFRSALDEGFTYFQGYFFTRPIVLARPAMSTVVNRLRFLAELTNAELDRERIVRLLKEEPSVAYRLLRLANSAAVSAREPMTSLHAALAMVGDDQFRKLAMLALAADLSGGKALEPIRFLLKRARFCELMASEIAMDPAEMYLFGMLSAVRAALHLTRSDIKSTLRLRPEILDALEGEDNHYAELLRLAQSMERGDWDQLAISANTFNIKEERVSAISLVADQWTQNILALA
ncbi:putative signal transduction protein containing EAL and modified HD-GYP domains [Terriglobus roseus DSM 18391]|uniref:Putative signal transduction protein containing EAL and modified HD-GYP domains n=1 Tax=Terriglobus roseus (strain DSM 18391 / NRRL B-41598 / KBS 63) TaxID=926566 RepID=I3ZKH8_TERRK|nr:EAL domain-containing protein [Terriglobus roseus]AFL89746.1 putative signal transduction protein containing EAL and modified HD-GYP domains [Terriglobus roseus DSM 18391]